MKVLVLGDAILDHYIYGHIERMSPEDASIPVVDIEYQENRLGGCLNVASNIKSLSNDTVSVSTVIESPLYDLLEERKIAAFNSYCLNKREGIRKTRIIANGKQVARIDNKKRYDKEIVDSFNLLFEQIELSYFTSIVISDYQKGMITPMTIEKIKSFHGMVFVDTKNPDLSIWKDIENCIVKLNRSEYEKAINKKSIKNCIVTYGGAGCISIIQGRNPSAEVHATTPVEDAEVTGAGDVFLAGLVVEYMKSRDLTKAIQFANMVATESVKHFGTTEVKL
jgi:rfaE bifunctional protein kinase chain/domain